MERNKGGVSKTIAAKPGSSDATKIELQKKPLILNEGCRHISFKLSCVEE
jgi:hypothetical protein